jgi:ectoine hydroxylase-related dioxygenase (phytanoyl-CoA dioxygenase family)
LDDAAIARLEDQVRETYVQHDRELSNPASRQAFQNSPPQLDEDQRDVLDSLMREGLAVVPFTKLFPESMWSKLVADSSAFQARVESDIDSPKTKAKDAAKALAKAAKREQAGKPPKKKKFILHRQFAAGTELSLSNPWLELGASPRIIDVVNAYLEMFTKLSYVDEWYTVPGGSEAERVGSQRWHRDYNDQHLVKVFVYMTDVDAGSGPFEYVPGSAREGAYANEWPWEPLGESYPDPAEFTNRIPAEAAKSLTAPAGTVIFCNTAGFHRGGFATQTRRVLGVLNYVSPAALASLVDRNFKIDASTLDALPEQVRFALT